MSSGSTTANCGQITSKPEVGAVASGIVDCVSAAVMVIGSTREALIEMV